MGFLSGVLFAASFFGVFYGAYKLGQKSKRPRVAPIDEEGQKKAEKFRQGFEQMMSYDVHTAVKGKKVT